MTSVTLDGHYDRRLTIDYCQACQAFWFDGMESVQLAPASVLRLFRIVGETAEGARPLRLNDPACPHCHRQLLQTHDQQRQSRFSYRRCPEGHGRLISFPDFLREKDVIKPLSAAQLAELRRSLESVNCSNCGAPVDLVRASVCAHCKSPLALGAFSRWLGA